MKIVILDAYSVLYNDLSFDFLSEHEVLSYDFTDKEDIIKNIGDAQIVFTNKCEITKEVVDACPNIKFIVELATGYNNIDVAYCREKNIVVSNIPSYASSNVSELVFAFLLDAFYNIRDYDTAVKNGEWSQSKIFTLYKHVTHNLAGKTIGIVGYGNTAKAVEKKALAFDMNVLINRRKSDSSDKKFVSYDELLQKSDIISLHIPLIKDNEKFINKNTIAKMKDGVVFINTARGGLIDEEAISEALNSGKISKAYIDVTTKEPIEKNNVLLKSKNIVITPHIGWAAYETRKKMLEILKENLEAYVSGKPINVVN